MEFFSPSVQTRRGQLNRAACPLGKVVPWPAREGWAESEQDGSAETPAAWTGEPKECEIKRGKLREGKERVSSQDENRLDGQL